METASRQMKTKIDAAKLLFEKIPQAHVDTPVAQALSNELVALEMRMALATGHLYIMAAGGESNRMRAAAEFSRILASENFAGEVDRLVGRAETALRATGAILRDDAPDAAHAARRGRGKGRGDPPARGAATPVRGRGGRPAPLPAPVCAEVQRLLDVYPRCESAARGEGTSPAEGAAQHVNYGQCPSCGGEMAVDAGRSELRCGECGTIRELVGTVFDDSQFYSQEGQKAKSGTFNPNRHFQFWWTHILAREPEEEIGDKDDPDNLYGEKLIAELRKIVAREPKILRRLTVADARSMLREVDRTDLNKNVPLILKKLTGAGPPLVSDAVAVRVENLFTKAIEIGERVRRAGRVNRNYYPYYIFKILDQLIPESEAETRRVLFYIYIQSKETVEADDADWEQICFELKEIQYVPTDRTKALQYYPQ